jgi:hypothetical protein
VESAEFETQNNKLTMQFTINNKTIAWNEELPQNVNFQTTQITKGTHYLTFEKTQYDASIHLTQSP